ncbi:MAG TPA: fumarylacetoacetate hydrolase family protein, partial [Vicinamibacterales bacterium]|nr:fumarylacetoacetate hydrolase family protein [Vicinamibacterales bacterium]
MTVPAGAQRPVISTRPETPFKLATFEAAGKVRVGLVLGSRIIDIESAHAMIVQDLALRGEPAMPRDMRTLIETYDTVAPGLYRIANYFSATKLDAPFVFDVAKVAIKAPVKYPYNLLAIAANYKLHAGEMFAPGSPQQKAANDADPDKEDPVFFAKSPRSCIIDPDESYAITPGRNIDWEGELAIVIGKPSFKVAEAQAHDHVFGYSIMYDLS